MVSLYKLQKEQGVYPEKLSNFPDHTPGKLTSISSVPDDRIQEIEQIIYEFLWNGKTHKVKTYVIIQDFKEGGHKMIDIR